MVNYGETRKFLILLSLSWLLPHRYDAAVCFSEAKRFAGINTYPENCGYL